MKGEEIAHRTLELNGIMMHVAEKGEGPVVLFLHGFPELWYSWRHQIVSLASRGFRAVAPDLRGYGDTHAPPDIAVYSIFHLVGDLVALINALGQEQVFVVGHDWGAILAWNLCVFRPDKVKAMINLSVIFRPRHPVVRPVDFFRQHYGDDYYICRFQLLRSLMLLNPPFPDLSRSPNQAWRKRSKLMMMFQGFI
ncbi:bifunctional epoxide hydrolase 2 isoform X2 [Dendrobium catenatum]|uniref:bifunctional epoxide hydrolase 2 isoform X2 n=1 Tax=Dendrobium catenatum TaxID=906689 RepID=UPI00109F2012|nr:bifunctional epoxide hydrolase 2 isoform X2 [Dendrobium catenatum]